MTQRLLPDEDHHLRERLRREAQRGTLWGAACYRVLLAWRRENLRGPYAAERADAADVASAAEAGIALSPRQANWCLRHLRHLRVLATKALRVRTLHQMRRLLDALSRTCSASAQIDLRWLVGFGWAPWYADTETSDGVVHWPVDELRGTSWDAGEPFYRGEP